MTINERFFKLLDDRGISQKDFSNKTGIPAQTISGWKTRKTDPPANLISSIADFFDVTTEFILTGNNTVTVDDRFNAEFIKLSTENKQKVLHFMEIANMTVPTSFKRKDNQFTDHHVREEPVYSTINQIPVLGKVAAGTPILSYSSDFGTIVPENKAASYALIVQGDSMYPIILDKEYIEVTSQPDLEQGEIGIIMVDGDVTCKKFYNFKDHYELRSLNPDYATITVPKNPSTNLQIIGKVSLTEAQMKRF